MQNSFAFDLLVHQKKILKNIFPFWPLSGGGTICDPILYTLLSPFPKNASNQIWLKSIQWF